MLLGSGGYHEPNANSRATRYLADNRHDRSRRTGQPDGRSCVRGVEQIAIACLQKHPLQDLRGEPAIGVQLRVSGFVVANAFTAGELLLLWVGFLRARLTPERKFSVAIAIAAVVVAAIGLAVAAAVVWYVGESFPGT